LVGKTSKVIGAQMKKWWIVLRVTLFVLFALAALRSLPSYALSEKSTVGIEFGMGK
jgi:hypothetical protein